MSFQTRKTSVHLQNTNYYQSVNCNFTKPREYFLRKKTKITNNFIPHFRLYCFSCGHLIVIFVFFAQKVFSWLHKITVDRLMSHGLLCRSSWYFSGPWSCKDPCCLEGQRALRFKQNYLNLCSEDERRSYGFGTTSGWVINDRIFIFG